MIVVSVGTNEARFDRLLEWVSRLSTGEPVVVQHGPSSVRPPGATCFDYLPYDELAALIQRSRSFVTHAGVGSIMVSLAAGRRPIVVPRLKRFGEAVDDHQLLLARRLASQGMVTVAQTQEELADALATNGQAPIVARGRPELVGELRSYILDVCRPGA